MKKRTLKHHIDKMLCKVDKGIAVIKKLYKVAIIGSIQGTSPEKIFQELGLESLKSRRWFRRLCCMFKIMKNKAPNYVISLIPRREQAFKKETNMYQPIIAQQIVLILFRTGRDKKAPLPVFPL